MLEILQEHTWVRELVHLCDDSLYILWKFYHDRKEHDGVLGHFCEGGMVILVLEGITELPLHGSTCISEGIVSRVIFIEVELSRFVFYRYFSFTQC